MPPKIAPDGFPKVEIFFYQISTNDTIIGNQEPIPLWKLLWCLYKRMGTQGTSVGFSCIILVVSKLKMKVEGNSPYPFIEVNHCEDV